MADNKNQHFVPQYYFRFFNGGGDFISLLLRRNGRAINNAPIRGQSSKNYFYGDAEAEKQITDVETHFILPLRRIKAMEDLSGLSRKDHELLVQGVMFQRARTMATRIDTQPFADTFLRLYAEVAINTNSDLTEDAREKLRGLLPLMSARSEVIQGMRMALSVQHANFLLDLGCILLKNKTTRPFVFGDVPVVLTNPAQKRITDRGVLGAKTPGLIAYYPLGPFEAIMLVDLMMYDVKGVRGGRINLRNLKDVEQLNKLQIHASTSAIYFHDYKYAEYVRYLWDDVGAAPDEGRGVVEEISVSDEKGLVHSYERQLPFFPQLTFLNFTEVPADSNFIDRDMYFSGRRA